MCLTWRRGCCHNNATSLLCTGGRWACFMTNGGDLTRQTDLERIDCQKLSFEWLPQNDKNDQWYIYFVKQVFHTRRPTWARLITSLRWGRRALLAHNWEAPKVMGVALSAISANPLCSSITLVYSSWQTAHQRLFCFWEKSGVKGGATT